jgi:hypothetical protein
MLQVPQTFPVCLFPFLTPFPNLCVIPFLFHFIFLYSKHVFLSNKTQHFFLSLIFLLHIFKIIYSMLLQDYSLFSPYFILLYEWINMCSSTSLLIQISFVTKMLLLSCVFPLPDAHNFQSYIHWNRFTLLRLCIFCTIADPIRVFSQKL